jgi:poly(hydroxyalkanoate) depolymerase family esterase
MKMNEDFLSSMREAMRLLHASDPYAATAALQQALLQPDSEAVNSTPVSAFTTAPDIFRDASSVFAKHFPADAAPIFFRPSVTAKKAEVEDIGHFSEHWYSNAAGQRRYQLYIPSGYTGKPLPLIVMLHGCTQDADDFATGTRMNVLAEKHDCFVVYPIQSSGSNTSKCWNWYKPGDQEQDRGEPSIIAGITRDIMAHYEIDPARVYVAGLSAGGAMANVMIHTYPDLYAAAGIHSGLPYRCAQDLSSALGAMKHGHRTNQWGFANNTPDSPASLRPIIVFHSDADTTVHPSNGHELASTLDARKTVAVAIAPTQPGGRASTRYRITGANGVKAEYWVVHGAPHAWSGGSPRGSYTDEEGPDASAEMLRFFLAHPQPKSKPLKAA